MRVLFTPHIKHYTVGLSRELAKQCDIWILSTTPYNTPSKQILIPNILKVRGLLRMLSLKLLPKMFDVVHVNTSREGLMVSEIDKLIVTEHGWPDPELVHESTRKYYCRERDALLYLHELGVPVITISNYSARMLRETYGVRVRKVIYHGLLEEFKTEKPREARSEHVFLWVSRLIPMKEPIVLLEALTKIHRADFKFKVIIIGEGPLKKEVKIFVDKNKLNGKVYFMSSAPFEKMPEVYNSCSVFVHTASRESFGLAVLEAMGLGLPVIVPKSGGPMRWLVWLL